jgi:hypothetical protein
VSLIHYSPSIKPYVCGHESCWPSNAASSRACYSISRGLSDHNKTAHPEDSGGDRPYRCGLEGCGKSWKVCTNLVFASTLVDVCIRASMDCSTIFRCELDRCREGLSNVSPSSKAHFQHAITSSLVVSSYICGLAVPESVEAPMPSEGEDKTKKQYKCPHENCPNRYKQLSGLRYHLAHVSVRVSDRHHTQPFFRAIRWTFPNSWISSRLL